MIPGARAREHGNVVSVTVLRVPRDDNASEAEDRIENLMELVAAADDYEHAAEQPTLADFVNRQSLLSEADEGDGPSDAQVWMMTLHAAKGLEFPTVVITGVEEGLLPHSRSLDTREGVEEEAAPVLRRSHPSHGPARDHDGRKQETRKRRPHAPRVAVPRRDRAGRHLERRHAGRPNSVGNATHSSTRSATRVRSGQEQVRLSTRARRGAPGIVVRHRHQRFGRTVPFDGLTGPPRSRRWQHPRTVPRRTQHRPAPRICHCNRGSAPDPSAPPQGPYRRATT